MKLYLVRHGESESNANKVHQGGYSPLTALGLKQAKTIARRVSKLSIEMIFTSDYKRTMQTTAEIKKLVQRKIIVSKLLREEKSPSEFIGKSMEDPEVVRIRTMFRKNYHKNWHYSDEENFFDLKTRVQKFLRLVERRKEKNILAVGHGMTTRMVVAVMIFGEKLTPEVFKRFRYGLLTSNTGITACEFKEGRWQVLTWNDHAHLG